MYVAGRREEGNAADGPFSAAVTVKGLAAEEVSAGGAERARRRSAATGPRSETRFIEEARYD